MEARNSLPDDLKPVFDQLREDYQTSSLELVGWGQPSNVILADLIRKGWRKLGESPNSN